jgi:hypothetical protein
MMEVDAAKARAMRARVGPELPTINLERKMKRRTRWFEQNPPTEGNGIMSAILRP